MKKICACFLALAMVVGITGCSADTEKQTDNTPSSSSETTSNTKTIELGETVSVGGWQYTLVNIQFADDVGNYPDYEAYLVSGGKTSNKNPFGLEEDETFAVVTYKLKNIGTTQQSLSCRDGDKLVAGTVGTGKFIYGNGYTFENGSDGKRAEADYYDVTREEFHNVPNVLEPLSDEIECRVAFCIPREVAEDQSNPLIYEVFFDEDEYGDNTVLTYTIR